MTKPSVRETSPDLDQRLQEAVCTALNTLVDLASDISNPNQARLAAAEILRFATRRKPEPQRPRQDQTLRARTVSSGLGAMLDLLTGTLAPMTPDLPMEPDRATSPESEPAPPVASAEGGPAHPAASSTTSPGRASDAGSPPDPLLRRREAPPRHNLSDIAGAPRGKK